MKKKFPYLEVSGSNYEVGSAIGKLFKNKVQEEIELGKKETPHYSELLKKSEPYFQITDKLFPNLIKELQGMADGAEVNIKDYFFMNNREVYDESENWDRENAVKGDHCTIAVSFNKDGAVVGHNEDWDPSALEQLYVLKATIGNTTFLGLQYADTIAGVSATMNNWGLVQCVNDLYQTNARIGVPKNFLARAVLECKTLDEAENLVKKTKRASGFNHVLVQDKEVRNLEIAGDKLDVVKVSGKPFVHTNHYLSRRLKHLEEFHTKSSEERYKRARKLVKPNMTKEDMMALLSDTKNKEYPICRPGTVGSLVLLPNKKEVWICYGHPCAGEYKKYTL